MTQQTPYFPLGGGLDLITPAIAQKPGSAISSVNYEPTATGYRRVEGYERFDGRVSPTDAPYYQLDFITGTAAFIAGDTITGATSGATGVVLSVGVATSGTYGAGDAAGYVGLGAVTGTFVNGENLQVSAVTRAVCSGTQQVSTSPDDATATAWQQVATANARALIQVVPGSGIIRGVWEYGGSIYAFRDQATSGAEKVVNGTGDSLTGWTVDPVYSTASLVGGRIRLQGDGVGAGSMWQQIATVPGVSYQFTGNRYLNTGQTGALAIGTTQGGQQYAYFPSSGTPMSDSLTFTATTTSVWITLGSHYDPLLYAEFDNLSLIAQGPESAAMYKSSAAGWVAQSLGFTLDFTSGGTYVVAEGDVITGATSGATATVKRIVTTSGNYSAGTAAGYYVLLTATGTFQAENLNVGANLNVATIAGNKVATTLPAGGRYEFVNHNFYGASQSLRMYGVNGVGPAFEWDGTTFTPIRSGITVDTPIRVAHHKQHLFLAFPGGALQNSAIGNPLDWTAISGAAAFGVGDEITDLIPANAGVLTILASNSIANLYGTSAADFQIEVLSDESGALPWTADKVGEPIYMDKRGVRALSATQAYGNFNLGTLSLRIRTLLQDYARTGVSPVASVRVRNKDHYRVFFSNGNGLAGYLGKKEPEWLPFDLDKVVRCIGSFEMTTGERIFFGSDDGYVYELDKGYSFDGEPINFSIRLPFNHLGAPQVAKRWHKVVVECQAIPNATISVSADFDYGDPFEVGVAPVEAIAQVFNVTGGGGIWDTSNWTQFFWSGATEGLMEAWLDGVGRNMSLLIAGSSAVEPPHLLQGLTLFYTVRGLRR